MTIKKPPTKPPPEEPLDSKALAIQQQAEMRAAEALGYVSLVEDYQLTCQEELDDANEFLLMVRGKYNFLEQERQISKAPSLAEGKRIDAWFKPGLDRLKKAEKTCATMIAQYHLKVQQERLALADAARSAGTIDEKVALVKAANAVPEAVNAKGVSTQIFWTYEVLNEEEVPEDLKKKILDHDLIVRRIDAGAREIPGIRIYQDAKVSRIAAK